MNERLQELYREAVQSTNTDQHLDMPNKELQRCILTKYAELVRQDEREANAKLLDDFAKTQMVPVKDTWRMGVMAAANVMRDKK